MCQGRKRPHIGSDPFLIPLRHGWVRQAQPPGIGEFHRLMPTVRLTTVRKDPARFR